MIRRLERLESDLLAERHARIDDLALLVDLVSPAWRAMNERLDRHRARPTRRHERSTLDRGVALSGRPAHSSRRARRHAPQR